jgi:prepilin-type N-terminal cleavage/methylation domain-containing protein
MQRHLVSHIASQKRRGFTLVELLVVIGIIAVLIGVLLPVLSKSRAAANRTMCLCNIRQLGTAILMYCNENNGWFPTSANPDDSVAYKQYADDWVWWQANRKLDDSIVAKYVGRGEKLKNLLRCPADVFDARKTYPAIVPGQGPYLYSYGMNNGLARNVRTGAPAGFRTKISQWRAPYRKIMLTEGLDAPPGAFAMAAWQYGAPITKRHGLGVFHGSVPGNSMFVTKMGANASAFFLDAHAEGIDQDFSFNDIQNRAEAQ